VTWLLQENANDLLGRPLLLAGLAAGEAHQSLSEELAQGISDELSHNYLKGPDFLDRARMIAPLAAMGRYTTRGLLQALEDEGEDVRRYAAGALGQLGQAGPEVIQALRRVLTDEEWDVRQQAVEALGRLGQAGPEVIQAIRRALTDEERYVRSSAAEALGRLGQAGPEVIQALRRALEHEDRYIRWQAVEALGRLGQAITASRAMSHNRSPRQTGRKGLPPFTAPNGA